MTEQINTVATPTEAFRGVGAAVAARLAHDGHRVVVNDSETAAPAKACIEAAGGHAFAVKTDVSDVASGSST